MGALNALQRSPGALTRNPVLVIPVLVIGLFQVPQLLLQATNPLLASLVSIAISVLFVLVVPFFQGGIIGMADEAIDGRTSLGMFVSAGREHYVNLLLAYLLLLVVYFVIGGLLLTAALVVGVFVLRGVELSGFALGFLGLFFVLFSLAFLLFVFFVQFYAQAIVLDDERAVGGIKRSVGLVRRNLLSTLGYSILAGVVGGVVGVGFGALSLLASPESAQVIQLPRLTLPSIAGASLVVVFVAAVVGSFLAIYSVAFYRDVSS